MSKHSMRAKWNTANAALANKPFDDLFQVKENSMSKSDSQYKDHPAYLEGWNAFEDATRRGANPYATKGPEASRNA